MPLLEDGCILFFVVVFFFLLFFFLCVCVFILLLIMGIKFGTAINDAAVSVLFTFSKIDKRAVIETMGKSRKTRMHGLSEPRHDKTNKVSVRPAKA